MDNFKNIVVGLDISKNSLQILKRAFSLANENKSKITIVHAIDTNWLDSILSDINFEDVKDSAKKEIEKEISSFDTNNIEYSIIVDKKDPSSFIINTAKDIQASLVIIGENSKENFETKVFGTTAHKVAQNSNIPLLIIKNNYNNPYENIVAFTDFSKVSLDGIKFSNDFFNKDDIKVVSAYQQASELTLRYYNNYENKDKIQLKIKEKKEEEFRSFVEQNSIKNAQLLEDTYSVKNILSEYVDKNKNDLVVLGSKGINNSSSLLYGSTSSYLMENLNSDILVFVP
ncbi:hypothetical protein FJR48_04280 [Sulfurimonas lithotrophica]|uniref:UspA domain-containing protein n=1 Tax=Sulfurimonas lithotrophica TaxID=2590022 RepID=A0A5P8P062_9BACT|nr:universal stress protein [Sulfurimonas lithotrophica]QFR48980.1 hypothetical protein FJR48_04280 [Sulfurimonas lithotrophica]